MSLTVIIQVAVGIMFVWILLALITSQIQDWVAQLFKWKANLLEQTIQGLLSGDEALKAKFYSHPLIQGLHTDNGKRKPGGIPSDKFALVLMDVFMKAGSEKSLFNEAEPTFEKLQKSISGMRALTDDSTVTKLAATMDTLLLDVKETVKKSDAGIAATRERLESWFDDSMDRLRGAYVRRMQSIAIIIGILLAAALNVDTLAIVNTLWNDPAARAALVEQANQLPDSTGTTPAPGTTTQEDILKAIENLQGLSLPIGWSQDTLPKTQDDWVSKIIGLLISGVAAAQGAPFWFDIMKKLLNKGGGSAPAAPTQVVVQAPAAPAPAPAATGQPPVEAAG
jgi:hypothetical protein